MVFNCTKTQELLRMGIAGQCRWAKRSVGPMAHLMAALLFAAVNRPKNRAKLGKMVA